MAAENLLVTEWLASFGNSPISTRDVLEHALGETANLQLRKALLDAVPLLAESPTPATLTTFLNQRENQPIFNGSNRYRFARLGKRWRLQPAFRIQ